MPTSYSYTGGIKKPDRYRPDRASKYNESELLPDPMNSQGPDQNSNGQLDFYDSPGLAVKENLFEY